MESLNEIWQSVLELLQDKYPRTVYDLWFESTRLILLDSENAVITIPSDLKKDIIENRYASAITDALCQIIGFDPPVTVISTERGEPTPEEVMLCIKKKKSENVVLPAEDPEDEEEKEVNARIERYKEPFDSPSIPTGMPVPEMGDYTFANFIVGSSNKMAWAACTAVARKPAASSYNPLFIYGDSGLGKTHLLYAIMNELKENYPRTNILYIKGEEFTNELIMAISNENTRAFRNKYRSADVLLIDDIQFIAGKESTQEEFFHTFNALFEEHKLIILAADRPPKEMKTLENRLRTRFEWGLIVDVQHPDYELRLAILKNKASALGMTVPLPVLQYLAENLRSSIRQLEGAIKKISAQAFLSGSPVTIEMAKACIAELTNGEEPVGQLVERIIDRVSKHYGLTSDDVKSRKKTKEIAQARHICIYIIRTITDMSLPAIGKYFGRDHTTVMSSISVVERDMKKTPILEVEINDLIRDIKEN